MFINTTSIVDQLGYNVTTRTVVNKWYISLEVVIALLAILGNSVVIVTYARFRRIRNVTNSYVFSLAVTDLLVALLGIPAAIVTCLELSIPFEGCLCVSSLLVVLCTASIFVVVAVTVGSLHLTKVTQIYLQLTWTKSYLKWPQLTKPVCLTDFTCAS